MIDNWEYRIFTWELEHLHQEFRRCDNPHIKDKIIEDIKLIREAIDEVEPFGSTEYYS